MKYILEIYDGLKTYNYPDLSIATPEVVMNDFSAVNNLKCVVFTDEDSILYAIEPFNAMRNRLGVEKGLSDEETLARMEEIINGQQEVNYEPSPEERMVSQLELQNLLAMPDVI